MEDSGKPGADTIEGQKALLLSFIENKNDMELISVFCDNGRTGTDFDRPQFEKMMDAVRSGKIDCIVVKDLSRFGRNYKETGNYLERIFPFLGVRFIAVNDNFDTLTAERTQDGYIVPLKNLINEVYSKDISKKIDAALTVKQQRGEFIGAWAPYGYRKDPNDKHHLVINEETAPTVKQIFKWRSEGISVVQIGRKLNNAGILSPSAYLYETGEVKTEKYKGVLWQTQIVKSILAHPVYIGHMVQGRKKQSFYEGKRQAAVDKENWIIVRNTHEPIIDEETFEKVQQLANQRKTEYHEKLGKIDDARFAKMSKRYEQEQGENAKKIKALRLELKKDESKRMDIDDFLETVRRYTDATAITKRMVAELIDHIEVYHAEKQDGVTNQRVVIYYNCIGAFDVPDRRKIPEADIIMETRKGVALSYAPEQVAV